MLAPEIGLAPVRDIALVLAPVAHRGKGGPRCGRAVPHIQHHRLPGDRPKPRQRRDRAPGSPDVFPVGDTVVVLGDQRADRCIAVRETEVMGAGVSADVDESFGPQPLFGQAGCPRDVQHRIGVGQQVGASPADRPQPGLVAIAPPVTPALADAEPCRHPGEVGRRICRIIHARISLGVEGPGRGRLEVVRIVAEAQQSHDKLHVHPGHARIGGGTDGAEHDESAAPRAEGRRHRRPVGRASSRSQGRSPPRAWSCM